MRDPSCVGFRQRALDRAERDRADRLGDSLHLQRRDVLDLERRRRQREQLLGNEDLPRPGLRHQARSEGGGAAEDRVRPPERRSDFAGEDAAAADPDRQLEGGGRVHGAAHRAQEPLDVVLRDARRSGDEHDPRPVLLDVALEEADVVLRGSGLHRLHDLGDRGGGGLGAVAQHQRVGAGKAEERHRGHPVLGLRLARAHVVADELRHAFPELEPVDGRQRLQPLLGLGGGREEEAARSLFSEHLCGLGGRCARAEQDLACLRCCLHLDRGRCGRPTDDQLAMLRPGEREEEAAGIEAGMHLQCHGPGGRLRAPDRAQRLPHLERCARRAPLVALVVEEDEQCVSAELEQAAAVVVRDPEQGVEGRVHHLGHLLGACLALGRELLGHRREAGDVDEGHRPVDLAPFAIRILGEPLDHEPRNIRREVHSDVTFVG